MSSHIHTECTIQEVEVSVSQAIIGHMSRELRYIWDLTTACPSLRSKLISVPFFLHMPNV